MDFEIGLRLTSLSIDGRRVPMREGELFAVRRADLDGLRAVDDPATRHWTGWVSAYNMFQVNECATIAARVADGRRLEGPASITTTVTPSGTYLELSASAGSWLQGLDD